MKGADIKKGFSVLAREGAVRVTLAEAAADKRFSRIAQEYFSSCKSEGLLIYVPKDVKGAVVEVDLSESSGEDAAHIAVFADKGSDAEVRESVRSGTGAVNIVTDAVLAEGSRVLHVSFRDTWRRTATSCDRHARILKDAEMTWLEVDLGCRVSRSVTNSELLGEGARVLHRSALLGTSGQEFDHFSKAAHFASDTSSELLGSHALGGQAKAFCRGLVRVEQGIRGCAGIQKDETILLSDDARMDSAPQLEINSDDVKCSHGSSIGTLDEESIFYLMSRGLDRESAERSVLEGFIMPVVSGATNDTFYSAVADAVRQKIAEVSGTK